jgi:hypothetical protein
MIPLMEPNVTCIIIKNNNPIISLLKKIIVLQYLQDKAQIPQSGLVPNLVPI